MNLVISLTGRSLLAKVSNIEGLLDLDYYSEDSIANPDLGGLNINESKGKALIEYLVLKLIYSLVYKVSSFSRQIFEYKVASKCSKVRSGLRGIDHFSIPMKAS